MSTVFVHGNPESADLWGPLTSALAERGVTDVVALSPPGFGAPTPPGWEPTRASYVGWLAAELEQLPGDVDLVGHDWGAGHVYGLLCEPPARLRSWAADCAGLLHPAYQWHDLAQLWQQEGAGEAALERSDGPTTSGRRRGCRSSRRRSPPSPGPRACSSGRTASG
jgi:pimeloyl-ACP methyl ester carboxylesterase